MVVLKKLFPLALFAFAGCWAPYFDEDLAASLALESKLGAPVLSFFYENVPNVSEETLFFIPYNRENPRGGFLVYKSKESTSPGYKVIMVDKIGEDYVFSSGSSVELNDKNIFTSGLPESVDLLKFAYVTYSGAFRTFDSTVSTGDEIGITPSVVPLAYGVNYFFSEGMLNGFAATLWPNVGGNEFQYEVGMNLPYSIFSGGPYPNGPAYPTFPAGSTFGKYGTFFRSGDGLFYIISTELEDGSYTTKVFSSDTLNEISPSPTFTGKVVGLVNNSTLMLVRNGANYEVYDLGGNLQSSFPAGSLYFCHDRYDAVEGKWYAVFARSLVSEREGISKARVDVFEWPSDKLGELGE